MSVLLFAAIQKMRQNTAAAVGHGYAPETKFVPGARICL